MNVARTVREFERAGAAAVQIEDQTFPKRCGHMEGKQVIPRDEMVKKVRAALAARADDGTVIIARTDAIAVTGLEDALARMQAYAEAGADVIFPDAPRSGRRVARDRRSRRPAARREHVRARQDPTPVTRGDRGARLRDRASPSSTLFAAAQSAREVAELLIRDGTDANGLDRILEFNEFNELVGLAAWQAEEERAAR